VTTVQHPAVLSDEDGEQMWVREDLVPEMVNGSKRPRIAIEHQCRAVIAKEFGLGDEASGYWLDPDKPLREMRRAVQHDVDTDEEGEGLSQWQVDDGWYLPVLEGQTAEVRYWRLTI
jgi:hypothetical protein